MRPVSALFDTSDEVIAVYVINIDRRYFNTRSDTRDNLIALMDFMPRYCLLSKFYMPYFLYTTGHTLGSCGLGANSVQYIPLKNFKYWDI